MSKLQHEGVLTVGLLGEDGQRHRSFSLQLLTVKNEIAMHEYLLMNHPDLDSYSDFKRYSIERVTRLSFMISNIGTLTDITPNILLDLVSEDFEVLVEAEFTLSKKLKEPIEQTELEAQ